MRVFDDNDVEVPWDGATVGEIVARSNHVMIGYWNRPEETADALRGGWLRTGDLAVVAPDGYLTIVDRKKDVIVSGGENIASVEVEKAIAAHPAVAEVAVIGVPDERWGEVPLRLRDARSRAGCRRPPSRTSSSGCARGSPTSRRRNPSSSSMRFRRAARARSRRRFCAS